MKKTALKKLFSKIAPEKKALCDDLIENAVFMAETLKALREDIDKNGCVETYQNGANQFGRKKSSEVEVYNVMIKNFVAVVKQLADMLPNQTKELDELMDYIK